MPAPGECRFDGIAVLQIIPSPCYRDRQKPKAGEGVRAFGRAANSAPNWTLILPQTGHGFRSNLDS